MNITVLRGSLSRSPERRALPSGDEVVGYEVTIPAHGKRPTESVPVSWFDAPSSAEQLEPDTEVVVIGRTRRRFFRAGGATQSRTEVVADAVVPARQAKRAARLAQAAWSEVEVGLADGAG
jgi:single-strand DNA-binding protein